VQHVCAGVRQLGADGISVVQTSLLLRALSSECPCQAHNSGLQATEMILDQLQRKLFLQSSLCHFYRTDGYFG